MYACVVYLGMVDSDNVIHTSLVIAKTQAAPIKRLTVPWLELCGAVLLAKLLHPCCKNPGISTGWHIPVDGQFSHLRMATRKSMKPRDLC